MESPMMIIKPISKLDNILLTLNDFSEIPKQPLEEHGIQSKRHSQLMCEAALEYTAEKINFHQVIQEDIDTLEAIIKLDEKFIGAKHLLGMIASNMGQYETAVQLFDNCIELSNGGCRREIIGRVQFQSDGSNPKLKLVTTYYVYLESQGNHKVP